MEINLHELQPLTSCPHSLDNVKAVKELEGMKINQVVIGSCQRKIGVLTDLRSLGDPINVIIPEKFAVDDSMFIFPVCDNREIRRGPNIKALPLNEEVESDLKGEVLIEIGD